MSRYLSALVLLAASSAGTWAHGLLIPEDKKLPPLAMLNHKVSITIEDQVAQTRVEQTFRNHTDRQLEATYLFPVPRGASVHKFTMWVDGKETKGEMVEAARARSVYENIVRRTQDPGLLEYLGNDLLRLRVFPIPAHGDQKVALSFTSVAPREGGVVEYVYPLKTDGKATRTLEDFSITATLKSQHGITNVYSPTHAITLKRHSDREVVVNFDRNQGLLDKDFQLYYGLGDKDVGLTALTHRPVSTDKGYFLLLVSPKLEAEKKYQVPRDLVLVLDTSGSMRGTKMDQARKALRYCLDQLGPQDRFGLINFATTVNRYEDKLLPADPEQLARARKWVDELEATGGTAINDALASALELRGKDEGRSFTVVFFTDGQPTIGESDPARILQQVQARNTSNTRIFTFGVGDDVNATLLDRLAEQTRALTTYVRPEEDIEAKASGLYGKISHPVLTDLRLAVTNDVRLSEQYPPQLPDLFHGSQLVVLGRYTGHGPAAVRLSGQVGGQRKEFVYELTFPERSGGEREFVEQLWARRKVGYLLDQVRAHGEKKELVDEVVSLAKKYGITTPYTSYLIVPDTVVPVVRRLAPGMPRVSFDAPPGGAPAPPAATSTPAALAPVEPGKSALPVAEFARHSGLGKAGGAEALRDRIADDELKKADKDGKEHGARRPEGEVKSWGEARAKKEAFDRARALLRERKEEAVQAGKLGVDLSIQMQGLRQQARLERTAVRQANGRNCLEIGGVWIDEGYDAKMPTLVVKAQSDAYFLLLHRQPGLREVFQLGNHLLWVTPSGTALVIDTSEGKDRLSEAEIDRLFVARK